MEHRAASWNRHVLNEDLKTGCLFCNLGIAQGLQQGKLSLNAPSASAKSSMRAANLHEGLQIQLPAQVEVCRLEGFLMGQI